MPLARTLAIVVFCASTVFAQQQSPTSNRVPGNLLDAQNYFATPPAATPSEPWRIIPEQQQANAGSLLNDQTETNTLEEQTKRMLASAESDRQSRTFRFTTPEGKLMIVTLPPGDSGGSACYFIHSYVVARDNKYSDATHKVSESTCQPAARYGVHTAEQRMEIPSTETSH